MKLLVNAEKRETKGKSSSRNLRRSNMVPGIIYSSGEANETISLNKFEIAKNLENENFYSQVIDVSLNGEIQKVILRDLQRHPAKREILHIDFQRVKADKKINITVSIHFENESIAPGVKVSGGLVSHLMSEIEISSLPDNLPQNIIVDLANLEIDQTIHLTDIKLPAGVEIVSLLHGDVRSPAINLPVVVIHKPKASKAEAATEEVSSAPEVESAQKNDKDKKVEKS